SVQVWADHTIRPLSNWMIKMRNEQIWHSYILDTYTTVLKLNLSPLVNQGLEHKGFAVIVEPRTHIYLEYVVRNVLYFLGHGWSLVIFHGNNNIDLVKHITNKLSGDKPI